MCKIEHDPTVTLKEERPLHIDNQPKNKTNKKEQFGKLLIEMIELRTEDPNVVEDAMFVDSLERALSLKKWLACEDEVWKAKETFATSLPPDMSHHRFTVVPLNLKVLNLDNKLQFKWGFAPEVGAVKSASARCRLEQSNKRAC